MTTEILMEMKRDKICKYQQLSGNMFFWLYSLWWSTIWLCWKMFGLCFWGQFLKVLLVCINICNINDNESYYYLQSKSKKQVHNEIKIKWTSDARILCRIYFLLWQVKSLRYNGLDNHGILQPRRDMWYLCIIITVYMHISGG